MAVQFDDIYFPGWEVVRKLGQGSFGGVYEIQRALPDGRVEKAALKKLSVPRNRAEIEEMLSQSFSMESITAYYKDQMSDLVREYSLMQELGSCGNVVTCHDIQYVQQEGGLGWDVYIRMELLRPLKKALGLEYQEETVLKLGLDLCNALKACQKKNIIHRDIKPENILVSEDGTFKLTDFGIAKVSEKTGSGTLTGTIGYMAPEVANRQHYGASADLYSLGMVLYWMMNKRTLPFLPLPPEIPTAAQRQEAVNRRLNSDPLPPPAAGSPTLKQVVLKACAFSPAHRYQNIQEFSAALEACRVEENEDTVEETAAILESDDDIVCVDQQQIGAKTREYSTLENQTRKRRKREKPNVRSRVWLLLTSGIVAIMLALFFCVHIWTPGSCTEPIKCRLCGKIKTDAPGHKWVEATCQEARYCKVCGKISGLPLGHQWKEATADTPKRCSRCGLEDGSPLLVSKTETTAEYSASVGDILILGHYEQDGDSFNGKESIEWCVLEIQDGRALLISTKGLDTQPFDAQYRRIVWENSTIRSWLNTTFLNKAFSAEEQAAILTTHVDNGKKQGFDRWNIDGGNDTQDKVFLLSYAEAKKYFDIATPGIDGPEKARIQPTKYAADQGAYVSEEFKTADGKDATRWWLRSPGCNQLDAACVHSRGCIGEQMCSNKDTCVRPAMWVDLNKIK